jgi:uncharacterized RDD family membrane protein YckC
VAIGVTVLNFLVLPVATKGRTLGKLFVKTRVVDAKTGEPGGRGKNLISGVLPLAVIAGSACYPALALVEVILLAATGRRIVDRVAGTGVK